MATLDCKDAFGSVTREILEQNLKKLKIQDCLKDVITDSYNETFVIIWNAGEASNPVNILKVIKQSCPLPLLLFNIYIDSIFAFIKKEENHKYVYSTKEFQINLIQAYIDDMILFSKSAKDLQSCFNDADRLFAFLNIKLNPKKCEIFRISSKKKEADFIKYLEAPLGSKRIVKTKFVEAKMEKLFYQLDKLEFSGLVINQMLRVIRRFIIPQFSCILSNSYIQNGLAEQIDVRIRRIINNLVRG
jgi:hypothetical protein